MPNGDADMVGGKPTFDFERIIARCGTGSRKWEGLDRVFGSADVLPLWIADMDFASPPAVSAKMSERASHPVYGYNTQDGSLPGAFREWVKRRHDWEVDPDWILPAPRRGSPPLPCLFWPCRRPATVLSSNRRYIRRSSLPYWTMSAKWRKIRWFFKTAAMK